MAVGRVCMLLYEHACASVSGPVGVLPLLRGSRCPIVTLLVRLQGCSAMLRCELGGTCVLPSCRNVVSVLLSGLGADLYSCEHALPLLFLLELLLLPYFTPGCAPAAEKHCLPWCTLASSVDPTTSVWPIVSGPGRV